MRGTCVRRLVEGAWGDVLDYVRIDRIKAVVSCNRYSVVAVSHEIAIANFEQIHGRKGDAEQMCLGHTLPSRPDVISEGVEVAIEIVVTRHAAHYAPDGHLPDTYISLGCHREPAVHLMQRIEPALLVAQRSAQSAHLCSTPRTKVVFLYVVGQIGIGESVYHLVIYSQFQKSMFHIEDDKLKGAWAHRPAHVICARSVVGLLDGTKVVQPQAR